MTRITEGHRGVLSLTQSVRVWAYTSRWLTGIFLVINVIYRIIVASHVHSLQRYTYLSGSAQSNTAAPCLLYNTRKTNQVLPRIVAEREQHTRPSGKLRITITQPEMGLISFQADIY